eukprot:TRINITY_DN4544_c0_g1_i10.p1 TRINITY_DN4544_c0_g1~~TRINITY_DN4544_c0_g1_i10.p1  ORF type:complete len:238 (-),score=37.68 TRINITY_DN4544_c0_g1_i10:619-1332(-)
MQECITFPFHLVPGPTQVHQDVLASYVKNYPSPDLMDTFFSDYKTVQRTLQNFLGVPDTGTVTIQSGEAMLALWGALKSCVLPGDKVLSIANGVFGYGVCEMAKKIGAIVELVEFEYNEAVSNLERIQEAVERFKPKLVTVIHCETPSGILNPISEIGNVVHSCGALYYVDFVASGFGVPVNVSEAKIDLGLLGSQKCLSLPPDLSIVTVSEEAWKVIDHVDYNGIHFVRGKVVTWL